MQKPPKLREARFVDHPQIVALAAKFDLHVESYPAWEHLWTNNPAYREVQGKLPMGWVLEDAAGGVAGYLGNVPLNYELEGRKLLAATTRAWVVDTPYRSYSPLLLGTYFQQRNVDVFLSTTVNSQSAAAYRIFEGIPVPQGAWDRTLFWITHYRGFAESFLRQKQQRLAGLLSYPFSMGLFVRDLLRGGSWSSDAAASVQPCSSFDDRFETFWNRMRRKKPNVLLAVRNQEALAWHFRFALEQSTAWIYVVPDGSGLAAYSIFRHHDYQPIGLTRMRLVDFQCLDPARAPDLLTAMLRAAMDRCRHESIQMLELVGLDASLEQGLERASPDHRALSSWLYYYKAGTPDLAEKLKNAAVWEPSLYDGDSSL